MLAAFGQAGFGADDEAVQRAVNWLVRRQNPDGGWGESNDTYLQEIHGEDRTASTPHQSAWALLGLVAAGEAGSDAVRCALDRDVLVSLH